MGVTEGVMRSMRWGLATNVRVRSSCLGTLLKRRGDHIHENHRGDLSLEKYEKV